MNLFQGAASASVKDSSFARMPSNYEYKIRKDDKINLSVWDHEDLSVGSVFGVYNSGQEYGKWLLVNARGEINAPKIGPVRIENLTVVQAEDSLRKMYGRLIKNPVIELKVLNKEATVLGELKKPGNVLLEKNSNTLLEVIGKAGDFDFYADKKKIKIIRVENGQPKEIVVDLTKMNDYMAKNIQILPGDIVYVPSRKGKTFDRRATSVLPLVGVISAIAIVYTTFFK